MEVLYHCIKAVLKECQKTGLTINKNLNKVENNIDINFDLPGNRVAFLYKFGTFNILFFKKCFSEFAAEYPDVSVALDRIIASKLICSLSNGPGTDIIGLQLALNELGRSFNKDTCFKIISKYGSWRNSMNFLLDISVSTYPILGNFKLLQCNVMDSLTSKAENSIKSADIILMDHAFASPNAQKVTILDSLKILLPILKPGAYVFFIDTKNKMSYFELFNSYGTYIYGPKGVQLNEVPYNEIIAEQIGDVPVSCGKAYFGVWQKSIGAENIAADVVPLVNVIPATCNFKENISVMSTPMKVQSKNITNDVSPLLNIPPQSLVNTIPATDSLKKNISIASTVKALSNNNKPQLNVSKQKVKESTGCKNDATQLAPADIVPSDKTSDHSNTYTEDMKALLCSLNSLVTQLENFVSSEVISKDFSSQQCRDHISACSCFCNNLCHNHHCTCFYRRCCTHF